MTALDGERRRTASRVLFGLAMFACYLWYLPFEAWWYLRFVLPAFPVIFALAADVAWSGTRRFGLQTRVVALGYKPYLLLEKWELPLFRERFAAQKSVAAVDSPPIAHHHRDVMIYRTDAISRLSAPDPIPVTSGCR